MKKLTSLALLLTLLVLPATSALAQGDGAESPDASAAADTEDAASAGQWALIDLGKTFGLGLVIIGAAYGIGKIGAAAVENMARQPEVAGNIQTAMIVSAALIEGATLLAVIVCLLALYA